MRYLKGLKSFWSEIPEFIEFYIKEIFEDFWKESKVFTFVGIFSGLIVFLIATLFFFFNDTFNDNSCDIWDMYYMHWVNISLMIGVGSILIFTVGKVVLALIVIPILTFVSSLILSFTFVPIVVYYDDISNIYRKIFPKKEKEKKENKIIKKIINWEERNNVLEKIGNIGMYMLIGAFVLMAFYIIYIFFDSILNPLC